MENKQEYLINWRNSVWVSMREKEKTMWQFLSFFAGALAIIPAFGINNLPFNVIIISMLLLTTWGLLITIDSNYWFNRNLVIVSNIESYTANYVYENRLIPEYYSKPKFSYLLSYRTTLTVLTVIFISIMYWFCFKNYNLFSQEIYSWVLILSSVVILNLWIYKEDNSRLKEYHKFVKATSAGSRIGEQEVNHISIKDSPTSKLMYASFWMISLAVIISSLYHYGLGKDWMSTILYFPFILLVILNFNIIKVNLIISKLSFVFLAIASGFLIAFIIF